MSDSDTSVKQRTETVLLTTNPLGWRLYINLFGGHWSFGTIPERPLNMDDDPRTDGGTDQHSVWCRFLGHKWRATLHFDSGKLYHRCLWCDHQVRVFQSSSRETRPTILQRLADPIVRKLSTGNGRCTDGEEVRGGDGS